ncbi:MAG: CdaR family transcriptional regulator [Solirubrobacterales bacterium]|nr:MAG: CdaR family transcriptional regulator [Solirubrobacterales bacterium]
MIAPDVVVALRPILGELSEAVIDAVSAEVPAYARPMEGEFGRMVRLGVERALTRFFDLLEDPGRGSDRWRQIYVELGRGEFREGRTLDALLAAYRIGARVSWRWIVEAGEAAGLQPAALFDIAEAMFAYIDELSAESVEGYASEQSSQAGARERARRALITALSQDPLSLAVVRREAARLSVRVGASVAALTAAESDVGTVARQLGAGAVVAVLDGRTVAYLLDPDAPGEHERLLGVLTGAAVSAAIGPVLPVARASVSLALARRLLALMEAGALPGGAPRLVDDELVALVVHSDPHVAERLVDLVLEPLSGLAGSARGRLTETLRAWLEHQGRADAVAHQLGVHPQTVRYRVNQLRGLFAGALDDPQQRTRLGLALLAAGAAPGLSAERI